MDGDLLESFLRVLQSAGHVRVRGAVWQLTRSAARWLDDDLVRAGYGAFSEYHSGLYRDLDSQLRGGPPRYDVRDRGEVIARVSAGFEPSSSTC